MNYLLIDWFGWLFAKIWSAGRTAWVADEPDHGAEGKRDMLRYTIPGTQLSFNHFGIKAQESEDRLKLAVTWLAPLQPHGMSLKLLDGSWAECSTLCSRGVSMSDVGVASSLATCLVHLKSFSPAACVSARILESQACHHQPRTSIIINNFINNFFCWEKTSSSVDI